MFNKLVHLTRSNADFVRVSVPVGVTVSGLKICDISGLSYRTESERQELISRKTEFVRLRARA